MVKHRLNRERQDHFGMSQLIEYFPNQRKTYLRKPLLVQQEQGTTGQRLTPFYISDDVADDILKRTAINLHLMFRDVEFSFGENLIQVPNVIARNVDEVELQIKVQRFHPFIVQSNMSSLRLLKHDERSTRNVDTVIPKQPPARETVDQIQLEHVSPRTAAQTIYVLRHITPQHGQFRKAMFLYRWRRVSRNPHERQFINSQTPQAFRCIPTLPILDHQPWVSRRPTA